MTALKTTDIAAVIAALSGVPAVKYENKAKAEARLVATLAPITGEGSAAKAAAAILACADRDHAITAAASIKDEAEAAKLKAAQPAARRAALRVIAAETPEAEPKPRKVRAAKPKAEPKEKGKTKRDVMLDMVRRPEGATEQEICEAIGWKACLVTLRRAAVAEGITLRVEKAKGSRSRYFAHQTEQAIAAE